MAYMIVKAWRVREALGLNDNRMEGEEGQDTRWGKVLKRVSRLTVDQDDE